MQSHIQEPACQTYMNYATLKLVVCSLKVLGSLILEVFKDRTNVCDIRMKLEAYVMCQVKKNIGQPQIPKVGCMSPLIIHYLFIYLFIYGLFYDSVNSSVYIPSNSLTE
jgi:hypothetical protein